MKTQYYTASSLDGFVADEDHALDWLDQLSVEESSYPDFIAQVGAIAMGSSTYEFILRHLSEADPPGSIPWPYEQPVWVFTSRELPSVVGADVRFASGDVAAFHPTLIEAASGRNVWVAGGGDLAGQFHDAGLLDEVIVQIASVTLGGGAPLLPRRIASPPLRLRAVRRFGDDLVELRYDVDRPGRS